MGASPMFARRGFYLKEQERARERERERERKRDFAA